MVANKHPNIAASRKSSKTEELGLKSQSVTEPRQIINLGGLVSTLMKQG